MSQFNPSNEVILSSEIIDYLKSSESDTLDYLNGSQFNAYKHYDNSESIFSNRYTKISKQTLESIFQSLPNRKASYELEDFSKDLLYSIASAEDLRTIVINAFLPLTNIRKSTFHTIELVNDKKQLSNYECYALLTNSAIEGLNQEKIASNQREASKDIIDSKDKFLDKLTAYPDYNQLTSYPSTDSEISVSQVNELISRVKNATEWLADRLSCLFSDVDEKTLKLTYHGISSSQTSEINDIQQYSERQVSDYNTLFGTPSSGSVIGWCLKKNSGVVDYGFSSSIQFEDKDIDLYPVLTYAFNYIKTNNVTVKQIFNANNRPKYVKSKQKITDGAKETIIANISNFQLPNIDAYFDIKGKTQYTSTFLGWKNDRSLKLYDYPAILNSSGNIDTDIRVNSDKTFYPVINYYSANISTLFSDDNMDIKVKNITPPNEDIESNFVVDVYLDGSVRKTTYPSNQISLAASGFKVKNDISANVSMIQEIDVNLSAVGNTQHYHRPKGYMFETWLNGKKISNTEWFTFTPAETEPHQDNFGNPTDKWAFSYKDGKPNFKTHKIKFKVQNLKTAQSSIDLSKTFLRIKGWTGYSTDSGYTYRCRLYGKVSAVKFFVVN